ncbi:MAG: divergent polysaccharide deacetylase family protein, partial [Pseudomonadota bacterium]
MGQGIFFGAFWGFLVGGLVLAVSSLLGELPDPTRAPNAVEVEVPAGSGFDQAGEDEPVEAPSEEPPVGAADNDAPLVTAPEAPPAPTLDEDVTTPADVPETGGASPLAPPPPGAPDSGVVVQVEASPAEEEVASAAAEPTAPPSETAPAVPEEPVVSVVPEASPEQEEEQAPVQVVEETPAPEAPSAQEDVAALEPEAVETDRPEPNQGGFGDRAQGVRVNRPGTKEPEAAPVAAAPPIQAFQASDAVWGGPDGRPLFSLVLIDEAGDGALLGALESFDGPLTFAIPGDAPNARTAMERYRAAGHEVAILADLPEGAAPSDVEQAMAVYVSSVPEAVALLDGTLSGFRGDRRVAGQVAEILSETGHGLLTFSAGLGTAVQIAEQAGIPTGTVFRDLDVNGQGNTVIRRFLDQAAFRAGQDGEAILLARMRAETISALLIWHQQ